MDKIAITTGDPNGIGAEITIKALKKIDLPVDKIVLISNKKFLIIMENLTRITKLLKFLMKQRILRQEKLQKKPAILHSNHY